MPIFEIILNSTNRKPGQTTNDCSFDINLPSLQGSSSITLNDIVFAQTDINGPSPVLVSLPSVTNSDAWPSHKPTPLGLATKGQKMLLKYPPQPLSGIPQTITTAPYGNGTYVANTFSAGTGKEMLDGLANTWNRSQFGAYFNTTGEYLSTSVTALYGGDTLPGEHYTIVLPNPIILDTYEMQAIDFGDYRYRTPTTFRLLGASTSNGPWTVLDTQSGLSWGAASEVKSFPVTTGIGIGYSCYRISVQVTGNPDTNQYRSATGIAQWTLYAKPSLHEDRLGQSQLDHTAICKDPNVFARPFRVLLEGATVPEWSAKLTVRTLGRPRP
jgi:hypothetical protein